MAAICDPTSTHLFGDIHDHVYVQGDVSHCVYEW